MEKSKLLETLRTLNTRERSRFGAFLASPYFNKHAKIRALWKYLETIGPPFSHPKLAKRKVFQQLYGQASYNEYQLNNLISDVLQLLYEFLLLEAYRQEKQKNLLDLMQELQERDLNNHLDALSRKFERGQQKRTERNANYFFEQHLYYEQMDQQSLSRERRAFDPNLQFKNDALDRFYFLNKLRIACDMHSRSQVVNANYEPHFLDLLLDYYQNNALQFQELESARVYFHTLQMLRQPEESEHYFQLKKLLDQHALLFSRKELHTLYNYALNHCVQKINSGQTIYYEEIFYLYKILLERDILFRRGHLSQWAFTNIITAGIRLRQYDWTERFIREYQVYLLPQERLNVYNYNLAALYFEKGEQMQALRQLHNVEFTDAFYHMAAKLIQLKSYYELGEIEAFFSLVEASRKFIHRNRQLSGYQKKTNFGFLKIATRLLHLREQQKVYKQAEFVNKWRAAGVELEATVPLTNKSWLLEKWKELTVATKPPP